MEFTTIIMMPSETYFCTKGSNLKMAILGHFFATDIGNGNNTFFKDWALESSDGDVVGGNCTVLEREMNDIALSDELLEEPIPTKLKMSVQQFVQLFDEWQEAVVKKEPKEVIIKYMQAQFFIETSDERNSITQTLSALNNQSEQYFHKSSEVDHTEAGYNKTFVFIKSSGIFDTHYITILRTLHGTYFFKQASNMEMTILGRFFATDIGCAGRTFFKDWAIESTDGDIVGGDCTFLEREMNDILLSDEYPEELIPTKLRITVKQFLELFDEWQEEVVKKEPKQVVIRHEQGQFFIETSNDS